MSAHPEFEPQFGVIRAIVLGNSPHVLHEQAHSPSRNGTAWHAGHGTVDPKGRLQVLFDNGECLSLKTPRLIHLPTPRFKRDVLVELR